MSQLYTIPSLEWKNSTYHGERARTPLHIYRIYQNPHTEQWAWTIGGEQNLYTEAESCEAAKLSAEQHWQGLLASCLEEVETTPDG
ncbi:MAG: hypothetical protein AAF512_12730 [Pseudomonadota bacterium]